MFKAAAALQQNKSSTTPDDGGKKTPAFTSSVSQARRDKWRRK